jgi:hypothetical protein
MFTSLGFIACVRIGVYRNKEKMSTIARKLG